MITAKGADIFRDDHIRSQSYFIIERKAHRGWRQWLPERYGTPLGLAKILVQVFFYYTKRRVEIHDENVVICKDCSRICFNMEVWLNAPAI
jgi:hypothetical protein